MAFLKDFVCRSCESTLGRWEHNEEIGRQDISCFTCGAGTFELNEMELAGLDYEEALQAAAREWGWCGDIHARLNSPGRHMNSHVTAKAALDALNLRWGYGAAQQVRKHVEIDVSKEDIQVVTEALNKIREEE